MNVRIALVVAALCLAQVFAAEKAAEPIKFEEVVAKTQTAINNMATEVQKALGIKELPDSQKLADAVLKGSQDFAKQIGDLYTEISSKPDLNAAVSVVAKKINTTVEDLKKQAPAVQAKASDLQKALQTSMQSVVAETQKLAESLSPVQGELKKSLENVINQVSAAALQVQQKVKEAIDTPSANV